MTDHDLLRQYVRDRSEPAFAELVRRHAPWVGAAAARQVRDRHLADDVTQAVLLVLATKAPSLSGATPLAPWLFGVLRLVVRRALRDERRRRLHERLAAEQAMASRSNDTTCSREEWAEVARVLDESVARLPAADRGAVLLRFYQRLSFADVGAALGNVSEEAARKRVTRALDRLRTRLARSGLALGPAELAPTLWSFTTPETTPAPAPPAATSAAGRPVSLAKGAIQMKTLYALRIPAACTVAAGVIVGFALLNRAAPPGTTAATTPAPTSTAAAPAATQVAPASQAVAVNAPTVAAEAEPAPPPPKALLDKVVPGVRAEKPIAADSVIELLQDSASVTVTVEWEKLGTRGDKGITLDLKPMPLRDMINGILKAAGATKTAQITVQGTKVHVTAAAPDPGKDRK